MSADPGVAQGKESRNFDETELAAFQDSLERASANPLFLDHFYEHFLGLSEEIRRYFVRTEMARLKRKLKSSLHLMTLFAVRAPGAESYVGYLGRSHHALGIPEDLYWVWLDALIGAVRYSDPRFDTHLERIWYEVMGAGIVAMQKAAHDAAEAAAAVDTPA